MESNRSYQVGYGRPPTQHRFQKGKSGNPSGARARPTETLQSALEAALSERSIGVLNGKVGKRTDFENIVLRQMQLALKADRRALRHIIKLAKRTGRFSSASHIVGVVEREDLSQTDCDYLTFRKLKKEGKDPWDYINVDDLPYDEESRHD